MYCKHYCIRSKKGIKFSYCRLFRKEITSSCCRECDSKEYKQYKTMKSRTNKQAKKEKGRFSIIYQDLTKCAICGLKICINKHEVFYGKNRQNSIKYGLVIPLCFNHHTGNDGIHKNHAMNIYYRKLFQLKWEKLYGNRKEFTKVFGQNYCKEKEDRSSN